jgi:hypothetical protein
MKNITIKFTLFFILTTSFLSAQNTVKDMMIEKINKASKTIQPNSDISSALKELKEITEANTRDLQLSAVTNALAGKTLSEKGYYDEAFLFLKKSHEYRKKIGIPKPQKWALKALLNNRNVKGDLKGVVKYAELWIKLIDESESKEIVTSKYFSVNDEFNYAINRVSPTEYLGFMERAKSVTEKKWIERREAGHRLIKTCLKKYPKFRKCFFDNFPDNAIPYYSVLMGYAKVAKDIEIIRYWEKKGLKTIKKYRTKEEYTDHLRCLVVVYNGSDDYWTGEPKLRKYEAEGTRMMQQYIKECSKIKRHEGVTFGHRYFSRRLRLAKDYQKSIQHLAEAVKYCRKHDLGDAELTKAFNGLFPIVNKIGANNDEVGFENAKKWKDDFSLKGLTEEDIKKIDDIVNDTY